MCGFLSWLLDKLVPGTDIQIRTAIKELNKSLKKNEKLLEALRNKASQELKNEELKRQKNEKAANQHLEMRRQYEESIENLGELQFAIKEEILKLEVKRAINEIVDALNKGVAARKERQTPKYIGDSYETIDGSKLPLPRLIQNPDSLQTTPVAPTNSNEDKLEAHPEKQEQVLQLVYVPPSPSPACPFPRRTAKEDVPAALQAEVAR